MLDRIRILNDDRGPSAQLSLDLKADAERSVADRLATSPIKSAPTLGGSSNPRLRSLPPASSSMELQSDGDNRGHAPASIGRLKRPQRYEHRKFKANYNGLYDLTISPTSASPVRRGSDLPQPTIHRMPSLSEDSAESSVKGSHCIIEEETPTKTVPLSIEIYRSVPIKKVDDKRVALDVEDRRGHATTKQNGEIAESDYDDQEGKLSVATRLTRPKQISSFNDPHTLSEDGYKDSGEDEDDDEDEGEDGEEDGEHTNEYETECGYYDGDKNGEGGKERHNDGDKYEDVDDYEEEGLSPETVKREKTERSTPDSIDTQDTTTLVEEVYAGLGLRDDSDFWKASRCFDQEKNWRDLTLEARKLIAEGKGLTVTSLEDLFSEISNGIDTYMEMIDSRSVKTEHNIVSRVKSQTSQVLNELYPYDAASPRKRIKLASTADEAATDIIPIMIGLVQWCLVAHCADDSITQVGIHEVTQILECLNKVCEGVQTKPLTPHPEVTNTIRTTDILVRFMIYVYKNQQVNTPRSAASHSQSPGRALGRASQVKPTESIEDIEDDHDWSEDESKALYEALQKYRGPDRYDIILSKMADALGHRSAEELRAKVAETRSGLLALPEEKRPHYSQWSYLDD